jgi:hypothetical protein
MPDPLIESIEGQAPAFRGLSYVVFEDLPLEAFGDRLPQLSFEVFSRLPGSADGLEASLRSVNLIPGTGEFALSTQTVVRRAGLIRAEPENTHNATGQPDLILALDQLQAQLPALDHVNLVVGWFGTDLRCGQCQVKPGVDQGVKQTLPFEWQAGGLARSAAHHISLAQGRAAFGGTPSDRSVIEAIVELRRRGISVTLYPLLLMDIPAGNGLANPFGGSGQPAYPWRGRITCHPAPGLVGTPDKTATATGQVASFFGTATAADLSVRDGLPVWSGTADFGYRRMILHYARLASLAGGVDSFLLGSELRGLTQIRSAVSTYPAVSQLRSLAADCRQILGPGTAISYAADWSEYFGHQPADGSGDVHFHLDPLWADSHVAFVGIDWYPPLTDWREGAGGVDAALYQGPHDPACLEASISGGEAYDWFYASPADRQAQIRTPINDGAHGETWLFRPKDLQGWWSHSHRDRPGGVRSAQPTAWVPGSKPIRLVEFGCAAVDRGANAPNLFVDTLSSEAALPPASNGQRDDAAQRLALEALLRRYGQDPMVERMSAWCWDSRPFPDFPARLSVWADGAHWSRGHWLNGRLGSASLAGILGDIARQSGVTLDAVDSFSQIEGYVIDRPMSGLSAMLPLLQLDGAQLTERGAGLSLGRTSGPGAMVLLADDLAVVAAEGTSSEQRQRLDLPPDQVTIRFSDSRADYQTASLTLRSPVAGGGGPASLDMPIVSDNDRIQAFGMRLLEQARTTRVQHRLYVSPLTLAELEPGDRLSIGGREGVWQVLRIHRDEAPSIELGLVRSTDPMAAAETAWPEPPVRLGQGPIHLAVLDLPLASSAVVRPRVACAALPWLPVSLLTGQDGSGLAERLRVQTPSRLGRTASVLRQGPLHRFDRGNVLEIQMESADLSSISTSRQLAGGNRLAVQTGPLDWEILSFGSAIPSGPDLWQLGSLLRGLEGTDAVMAGELPPGALVVILDDTLTPVPMQSAERGLPLVWRAVPAGGASVDVLQDETRFSWRDVSLRPFAVAHLVARRRATGGALVSWIPRGPESDDGWQVDSVALPRKWRIEVRSAGTLVRTHDVELPVWDYPAASLTADETLFGSMALTIHLAEISAPWGVGPWRSVDLL